MLRLPTSGRLPIIVDGAFITVMHCGIIQYSRVIKISRPRQANSCGKVVYSDSANDNSFIQLALKNMMDNLFLGED